ncbi:MAG: hypothetical protein Q8Q56_03675, partial [Alphaproteobacteria bacterium]|nr:hypothetical protein [Alphaproteobacteria bacterium]
MLKKLLLTAALLSSTYGAATDYVDPDFSLLANRSETLVIDEEGVVIHPDAPKPSKLRRLTQSEVSTILSSDDCKVLSAAAASYFSDIFSAVIIRIILKADTTSHNGVSEAQDATFLSQ